MTDFEPQTNNPEFWTEFDLIIFLSKFFYFFSKLFISKWNFLATCSLGVGSLGVGGLLAWCSLGAGVSWRGVLLGLLAWCSLAFYSRRGLFGVAFSWRAGHLACWSLGVSWCPLGVGVFSSTIRTYLL